MKVNNSVLYQCVRFSKIALMVTLVFLMTLPTALFTLQTVGDKVDKGATPGSGSLKPTMFSLQEEAASITFRISVGEYNVTKDSIEFDQNVPIALDGLPILPSIVKLFIVGEDKRVTSSVIVYDENVTIDFVPKIQVSIPKSSANLEMSTARGSKLNGSLFPATPFMILGANLLETYPYRLCYFVLYPAQYDPSVNKTVLHRNLVVKAQLAASGEKVQRSKPQFEVESQAKYGSLSPLLWMSGRRGKKAESFDSLYVADGKYSAMAIPICIGRRDKDRYGIVVSPPPDTAKTQKSDETAKLGVSREEAKTILGKSGYVKTMEATSKSDLLNIILSDYQESNGLVVSSPEMADGLCPIASYLDWPLYVYESSSDDANVKTMVDRLKVKSIILAGCNIVSDRVKIEVRSQKDANALLHVIERQTGYREMEHPEDSLMRKVLNPTVLSPKDGLAWPPYLILYSTYDIPSSAVALLASYRHALMVNVNGITPAKALLDIVKYYSPWYLALVGDGDYWETDQFFAPDPVGTEGYVPTDFFYEQWDSVLFTDSNNDGMIESVTWPSPSGQYTWGPDCFVGRVMCYDSASFQTYFNMVKNYELGKLSYAHQQWLAFFSYFCKSSSIATWDVHDTFRNHLPPLSPAPTYHAIHHDVTHGGCPSDYDYRMSNLDTFEFPYSNNIFYFNTHGSHSSIAILKGTPSSLTTTGTNGVASHHTRTDRPAFFWVDACLCSSLGNEINPTYTYYPGGVNTDDDTCIGCRFLAYGALGFLGSSLLAYIGDFDAFDRALAIEMCQYPRQTIAESINWARARYYSSVGGGDAYTKKTVLEVNYFGDPAVRLWWTTPVEKGYPRIELFASPTSGYINKPVTIYGVMYGSWRCIKDGVVVYKPVYVDTGWGLGQWLMTDYDGRFSVTTNCPSTGGWYWIQARFFEDDDLLYTGRWFWYYVTAKIPTTISIDWIGGNQFAGYLRRADTNAGLGYKPIKLTVHYFYGGAWQTTTYSLETWSNGYWRNEFGFNWNWATVVFEGDETYDSSSATITR